MEQGKEALKRTRLTTSGSRSHEETNSRCGRTVLTLWNDGGLIVQGKQKILQDDSDGGEGNMTTSAQVLCSEGGC